MGRQRANRNEMRVSEPYYYTALSIAANMFSPVNRIKAEAMVTPRRKCNVDDQLWLRLNPIPIPNCNPSASANPSPSPNTNPNRPTYK